MFLRLNALLASIAHKHLKQSLTGDMCFTVPMLNLPEKLEIKDLGQLQSIELIPYIAKQLGIESAKILVSDQHTGKPYYFKLNNNKCELHINENPIQPLFEIIHNGEHFDIKVPEDLHGPFVDNNDYDKMEGFTAFIEEYTKGGGKNIGVITMTALNILDSKLGELTKTSEPATRDTEASNTPQAQPKSETPQENSNTPQAQPKSETLRK